MSRTKALKPGAGSGVSRPMPARASAAELTQAARMSDESNTTDVSGHSASRSALFGPSWPKAL